jgi:hypothetical protein
MPRETQISPPLDKPLEPSGDVHAVAKDVALWAYDDGGFSGATIEQVFDDDRRQTLQEIV